MSTISMGEIKKTSFRIDSDLVRAVKQYALDNDTSATDVITQALQDFFAAKKRGSGSSKK